MKFKGRGSNPPACLLVRQLVLEYSSGDALRASGVRARRIMNKQDEAIKSAASGHRASSVFVLFLAALGAALTSARATVAVSPLYGSNMVIQRDQPFPVRGTASPNKTITVAYNSLTNSTTADSSRPYPRCDRGQSTSTHGLGKSINILGHFANSPLACVVLHNRFVI